MKALILNSPIYREPTTAEESYLPPLGLGYILSELVHGGVEAELCDCVRRRMGADDAIRYVAESGADFVGINVFTQNYDVARQIVEGVPRRVNWLVGGPAVKSTYRSIVEWNSEASLTLVIGEGEPIVPAIVGGTCMDQPIWHEGNRLVYRVDGRSPYLPRDLDAVQLNRDLLGDTALTNHYGQVEEAIVTSRGCLYDCAFCGGARSLNRDVPIRYRSADDVGREVASILARNCRVTSIRVLDDLFLRDRGSIEEAIGIFGRFPTLSWRGMAHVLTFTNLYVRP